MNLSKMKLGARLALGFALILAMMAIMTVVGVTRLRVMNHDLSDIVNNDNQKVFLANEMVDQVRNIAISVRNLILADDKTFEGTEKAKLEKASGIFRDDHRKLAGMVEGEEAKKMLTAIETTEAALRRFNDKALALDGEQKDAEAVKVLTGEADPVTVKLLQLVDDLIRHEEKLTKEAADRANTNYITASSLMIGMGGLALIFGGLIAFFLTRSITRPINRVIAGLTDGADQVASASAEVASSSQSLAEGSSEQASSLEETSSSLEEMASMTKQNAGNANQARTMMAETKQIVEKVDRQMNEMAVAINEINKTSEETGKIIKTIDEIAFQTNLLALNAAVEAARAGEAGAGFAVVADEVRNLALRAAEAARNTSGLIENTIKAVKQGNELTQAAQEAFRENVTNSRKVAQLIDEIASASDEQAQGIDQINKAVSEMDRVTQQTAASAEESASASEELTAQAEQMKGYVRDLATVVSGNGSESRGDGENRRSPAVIGREGQRPQATTRKLLPGRADRFTGKSPSQKRTRPEQVIPLEEDNFKDF